MWKTFVKIAAATAAFGAVHSVLASRRAKRASVEILGPRTANGLYRVFYILQSAATAGLLAEYIRRQPSVELYRIRGHLALLMHAGQMAALFHATASARQVGVLRISGIDNFIAWANGEIVPSMPEAQGPALDGPSEQRASGPFAWSRHPLNFSPIPILWLWPRMTSSLFAFNVAATCYLVIGSRHEESRLLEIYGDEYERYRSSGIPFYWPEPNKKAAEQIAALLPAEVSVDA